MPLLAGVWRAIAFLMKPWCAEEEVSIAANLLSGMEIVCVGWHRDDEPLFGKFGFFQMEDVSPVRTMKDTCAALAMVALLSWMVNVRMSSFIGWTLAGNRNG